MDAVNGSGATALIIAACWGQAECARLLLEAGADASLRGTGGRWEGKTALELAEDPSPFPAKEGHAEVAALINADATLRLYLRR